jgi:hypothetical protein
MYRAGVFCKLIYTIFCDNQSNGSEAEMRAIYRQHGDLMPFIPSWS